MLNKLFSNLFAIWIIIQFTYMGIDAIIKFKTKRIIFSIICFSYSLITLVLILKDLKVI